MKSEPARRPRPDPDLLTVWMAVVFIIVTVVSLAVIVVADVYA